MTKSFWGILGIVFALLSCRSDDESLQRIDQILNIYMKDGAGQDLLNSKKAGSFSGYSVNDLLGDRDNSPVSIPLKVTSDSLFYMEYIAGAKRKRSDSTGPDNPGSGTAYYSEMLLALRRTTNNVSDTINDTLRIEYRLTPTVFQVSKVLYNSELVFSKEEDEPNSINTVTIIK